MKKIICEKSHLVRDADDLKFLEQIVQEISLQEFRTEMWKSTKGNFSKTFGCLISGGIGVLDSVADYNENDWTLEVNCADFSTYKDFSSKMEEINRDLIAKRRDIDEGIAEDQQAGGIISALGTVYHNANEAAK